MQREEIRRRLAASCELSTGTLRGTRPGVPAAVLVGLVARADGPHVILTERTAHLTNHPAEVSFPGGRIEPGDDGPEAAALREAFEEIGLDPAKVELLGCLPPYRTITDFCVSPVVGWIEPPVVFDPDREEVADIFEVPLSFVLDPANHRRESIHWRGDDHSYFVLPYPGRRIWGATAGMLVDLARALAGSGSAG
jgi:8-oxo-dGTP pyrophosphatase MutT (NUDIX family)